MPAILYLSRGDVEGLGISVADVIRDLEAAFAAKGRGEVEMPPKPGIHPRADSFIHAMPAYVRSSDIAGLKWISGFPDNPSRGLPYISGLMILNDPATGVPLAVMDASWITAVRTGAATAVAAKYLARREATHLAFIGCGVQARSNLDALAVVQPRLTDILAYDIRPEAAEAFAEYGQMRHRLRVAVCRTPEEAVRGAELIVTATPILKHPTPVLLAGGLRPGGVPCPLRFGSPRPPGGPARSRRGRPARMGERGDIGAGRRRGRERPDARVISINLGLALEDVVTAHRIYQAARTAGAGRDLEL